MPVSVYIFSEIILLLNLSFSASLSINKLILPILSFNFFSSTSKFLNNFEFHQLSGSSKFSAEHFEQANARVNRPGQKHKMTILRLGATPVEWAAYAVADAKVDRQKKVLDLYKNILSGSLTSPH